MKKIVVVAAVMLVTQASAAGKEHAECITFLNDAYEGINLVAGNQEARIDLLQRALAMGSLSDEQNQANNYSLEAALAAMMAYVDTLSETCEAMR